MDRKIRISEATKILGVSVPTLRNWDKSGKLKAERSTGNQRYYSLATLKRFAEDIKTLGLAWAISAVPGELPSEYYCDRSDRFTSRVTRMGTELQLNQHITEELASLITLVAGEIGDNSFAHNLANWKDAPGVFYAYDPEKRMVVIADRGRGVKTTLRQVRPSIATDLEALKVAFTELISGRSPEKRGNGLKVVRGTVELKEIGLFFHSGTATASVPMKKPGVIAYNTVNQNVPGTYCLITF